MNRRYVFFFVEKVKGKQDMSMEFNHSVRKQIRKLVGLWGLS